MYLQKMKTSSVIFILNFCILIKISEAQVIRAGQNFLPPPGPMPKPELTQPPPPPPPQQPVATTAPPPNLPSPQQFDRTPKCYPETAKAYFLPAPPSSPKVTVLDHNLKDLPASLKDLPSIIKSDVKEIPSSAAIAPSSANLPSSNVLSPSSTMLPASNANLPPTSATLASNIISNRPSFVQPPLMTAPMLPDLIEDFPSLVQDKYSRVSESDVKVCDTCASLMSKLPIFKFDQELLDGFLAGLGL